MAHQVFISHSQADKSVARSICDALEHEQIRCWMAPRDVPSGTTWAGAILDAIQSSSVMVVVASSSCNASVHVMREVERAVNKGLSIIPFRIDAVPYSKDLEYYLSSVHWVDASSEPLQPHLALLVTRVRALIGLPLGLKSKADPAGATEGRSVGPASGVSLDAPKAPAGAPPPPTSEGWARTCGDGRTDRLIDAMDDPSRWSVVCSDQDSAPVVLRSVAGCRGRALAIDYELKSSHSFGTSWLTVLRRFDPPLDLSAFTHLRIGLRGSNPNAHDDVSIRSVDRANRAGSWSGAGLAALPAWRAIYVNLRALSSGVEPAVDLSHITGVDIGIERGLTSVMGNIQEPEQAQNGRNVLSIGELSAVDLGPGARHRFAPAPREPITRNAAVRAAAAAALRDRLEMNGVVPAWYEESGADYNTYAQSLRILVMVREHQLTGDESYREAAQRALSAMLALQLGEGRPNAGAWFTGYERNGARVVPRNQCTGNEVASHDQDRCCWVGNTAWMLIALDRARAGLPGDHAAVNRAIDRAADWLVGLIGRFEDAPEMVAYGLEGNISAYFALLAAHRTDEARSLGAAIFNRGWDPIERRMKTSVLFRDGGISMDTAGSGGVWLLRCLGKEAEAQASQAYVASMLRTCSFDGTRDGYGDGGPWTLSVESGAQGAGAGILGADHVMAQIHALQAPDGSFPASPDDFSGGGCWLTRMHGVAPTAWVYFANVESPLAVLSPVPLLPSLALSPSTIDFRAVDGAGIPQSGAAAQPLALTQRGVGVVDWTAEADQSWISISPSSGRGPATITASVESESVTPASSLRQGAITIRAIGAVNPTLTARVRLT